MAFFIQNIFVFSLLRLKLVENKCMKTRTLKKKWLLVVIFFSFCFTINAQDKDNPWLIGFGINAVDFYPTNIKGMVSETGVGTEWYDQFFNLNDHYNYITAPSKLSLSRYISPSFSAELALSINKLTEFGSITLDKSVPYFAVDVNANYNINSLIGDMGFFDPYIMLGGGYNMKSGSNDNNILFKNYASFNSGLGAKFWIYKGLGIRVQSSLKYFFNDGSYRHFQHSASIIYKFGAYDSDNDGIIDSKDNCPETFGVAKFNGCPDTDEDGIQDAEDECPTIFGMPAAKGCPDTDGDGVPDNIDECPTLKGIAAYNGCPDTDGDGIIDIQDLCPTIFGVPENKGCPYPDTDGDGTPDNTDKCKLEPGPPSNFGCPVVKQEQLALQLTEIASNILFVTGSDVIYPKYQDHLNEIATLMIKNGNLKFQIEGYTDNVGEPESNYRLSIKRVNAVLNYLVNRGVSQLNLSAKGFGENAPIASNDTAEGRAKNRRVEIKIVN
jgi:outer membrane protein OmpA-like peptidoglycan-associated protein